MMMMIGSARVDNPTVTVRFRRLVIVEPREAADADEHGAAAEDENGAAADKEERAEGDFARHYGMVAQLVAGQFLNQPWNIPGEPNSKVLRACDFVIRCKRVMPWLDCDEPHSLTKLSTLRAPLPNLAAER